MTKNPIKDLADIQASQEIRDRVADLIAREKGPGLTADETAELDGYLELEHRMRLLKARARRLLGDE